MNETHFKAILAGQWVVRYYPQVIARYGKLAYALGVIGHPSVIGAPGRLGVVKKPDPVALFADLFLFANDFAWELMGLWGLKGKGRGFVAL